MPYHSHSLKTGLLAQMILHSTFSGCGCCKLGGRYRSGDKVMAFEIRVPDDIKKPWNNLHLDGIITFF
eukprot:Gb_29694 [translate_table: standard]